MYGLHKGTSVKWKYILPQVCWWFFPETTSGLRRPSSAAGCWSGPPCSAPRAFCPRGSWERGSPRRTHQRCPACGRQTGGWCGPRARQTTRAPRQSRNLEKDEERGAAVKRWDLYVVLCWLQTLPDFWLCTQVMILCYVGRITWGLTVFRLKTTAWHL